MSAPLTVADREHVLHGMHAVSNELRGARIFITGGTGFVGTWLVEALVAADEMYGLGLRAVLLTRDAERFRRRAPHLAGSSAITLLTGDVRDFAMPAGAFTHVIHAATQRAYRPDATSPLSILADDERATRRVLAFCAAAGVKRMLFTSSGAIYGAQPPDCLHVAESDPFGPDPTDPRTVYGQSKRLSEFTCIMHGATSGLTVTIARLFAFVGPYLPLDEGYAVGNFLRDVLAGEPPRVGGDGTPLRSYLYAADMAVWLWRILAHGAPGRAYNVGSPAALSIAELARAVAGAAGREPDIVIAQRAIAGAPAARYVPCVLRAQTELQLTVGVDLASALARTLEWHRRLRESSAKLNTAAPVDPPGAANTAKVIALHAQPKN